MYGVTVYNQCSCSVVMLAPVLSLLSLSGHCDVYVCVLVFVFLQSKWHYGMWRMDCVSPKKISSIRKSLVQRYIMCTKQRLQATTPPHRFLVFITSVIRDYVWLSHLLVLSTGALLRQQAGAVDRWRRVRSGVRAAHTVVAASRARTKPHRAEARVHSGRLREAPRLARLDWC